MKFNKYSSFENITNKQIEKIKSKFDYDPNALWEVTEKCDGSNFSIWFTKDEIKFGKRTDFLYENSDFYNFQSAMKEIDLDKTYKVLCETFPNFIGEFVIFGELCGGYYPDAPVIPNAKKVQKRVNYTNKNEFIAYDIVVALEENSKQYIPHECVVDICNKAGVKVIPVAFTGTLNDCIEWSSKHNEDNSELWKVFGMEKELPVNIREGNVIKLKEYSDVTKERLILKDKNEKFKESNDVKETKPRPTYSLNFNKAIDICNSMITTNRFYSATSKYGEYTIKNFQDLMNLMIDDVVTDFLKEDNQIELDDKELSLLRTALVKHVSVFMGKNKKELF